jgi:hypothetical protein
MICDSGYLPHRQAIGSVVTIKQINRRDLRIARAHFRDPFLQC